MKDITLRDLCKRLKVSRRAIQGYESAGLVSATGKNERGHLLYDEAAQERIQRIVVFRQFGFQVKEIKGIIDAPNPVVKKALQAQAVKLEVKEQEMSEAVKQIYIMIEAL